MNALDWLRESAREPLRPVYVISGDDAYLIRESMTAIARAAVPENDSEASIKRFGGATTQLADVLDEVSTLPFFARRRLVIVEEADPFVSRYRKDLESYVRSPSRSGVLLLQVKRWAANTILAQLVAGSGLAIDCSGPPEGAIAPWLIQLARDRHQTELEADAARLLVDLVGSEAGVLASEVEKLAVYAGESRRITRGEVLKLVGAGRVETIWKAVDAATTGQARVALEHLENVLAAGEEPIAMLAAVSSTLLKVHHAGRLRAARLDLEEACQVAGIPSFAHEKTRRQHAHLGPSRVDQLPSTLLRADLDLKGGSLLDPRLVLEMLLIGLARPRRD